MGWFSDLGSAIGSAIDSAISIVGSTINKIGKVIADNAEDILKLAVTLGPKIHSVLKVIVMLAQILEVFKDDESLDEMGAKAMKSDKSVDDFDSVDEYIQHLRNDIQLSKEELEDAPAEKKWARKAVGASIALKGISEKKEMDVSVDFIAKAVNKGLGENEINDILNDFKNNKLKPQDFLDYIKNCISTVKEELMDLILEKNIKKAKPELSASEIEEEVLKFTKNN